MTDFAAAPTLLEVIDVHKSYGRTEALKGVSFVNTGGLTLRLLRMGSPNERSQLPKDSLQRQANEAPHSP